MSLPNGRGGKGENERRRKASVDYEKCVISNSLQVILCCHRRRRRRPHTGRQFCASCENECEKSPATRPSRASDFHLTFLIRCSNCGILILLVALAPFLFSAEGWMWMDGWMDSQLSIWIKWQAAFRGLTFDVPFFTHFLVLVVVVYFYFPSLFLLHVRRR